jgi:hypothetical protein
MGRSDSHCCEQVSCQVLKDIGFFTVGFILQMVEVHINAKMLSTLLGSDINVCLGDLLFNGSSTSSEERDSFFILRP